MTIAIGILGAARIAPPALIQPARETGLATVAAIGARDLARARAFAETHGVPLAVEGYQVLVETPGLDTIYNALPTSRHADTTLTALEAGRHVLCEKPFTMSSAEARAMVEAADRRGLILMEAFHYRYHPFFARLLELVTGGAIGELRRIEAVFTTTIAQVEGELRFDASLGGGALMDLGTYCVHWCRTLAGEEPSVAWAEALESGSGVDLGTRAELLFPSGITARVLCHMAAETRLRLDLVGTGGRIQAVNPMAPQFGGRLTVATPAGSRSEGAEPISTYACQLRAFVAAIRTGAAPLTGGPDAIAQMLALEAIAAIRTPVSAEAFEAPRP